MLKVNVVSWLLFVGMWALVGVLILTGRRPKDGVIGRYLIISTTVEGGSPDSWIFGESGGEYPMCFKNEADRRQVAVEGAQEYSHVDSLYALDLVKDGRGVKATMRRYSEVDLMFKKPTALESYQEELEKANV